MRLSRYPRHLCGVECNSRSWMDDSLWKIPHPPHLQTWCMPSHTIPSQSFNNLSGTTWHGSSYPLMLPWTSCTTQCSMWCYPASPLASRSASCDWRMNIARFGPRFMPPPLVCVLLTTSWQRFMLFSGSADVITCSTTILPCCGTVDAGDAGGCGCSCGGGNCPLFMNLSTSALVANQQQMKCSQHVNIRGSVFRCHGSRYSSTSTV